MVCEPDLITRGEANNIKNTVINSGWYTMGRDYLNKWELGVSLDFRSSTFNAFDSKYLCKLETCDIFGRSSKAPGIFRCSVLHMHSTLKFKINISESGIPWYSWYDTSQWTQWTVPPFSFLHQVTTDVILVSNT